MRVRCNSCQGVYDTVQPDGLAYFHVCPGIRALRVLEKDGSETFVKPGDEGTRPVLGERIFDRPNGRDERPILNPQTGKMDIRKAGAGVTPIASSAPRMDAALTADGVLP
jgi:hypothetical protein